MDQATSPPLLTVVIPTTAESSRKLSLARAIESIHRQDISADIVLIVNGTLFDKELFISLQKREDLKVFYLDEGSLPKAIHFGVSKVTTPFFAFLDDDDCYIENTLYKRMKPLLNDDSIDFVVNNGFNYSNGADVVRTQKFPVGRSEAAGLILQENWLASCGGIYRRTTINADFFENIPKYLEWTYLGFKLATTKKGCFLSMPAFRIYESTLSLSKSNDYTLGMMHGLRQIIELSPEKLRRQVKIKYGKMLHDLSSNYLSEGEIKLALKFHLSSLIMPKGYLYIYYSRHILSRLFFFTGH
jgi:glycosyltransferase involved in cell wall biosynthesis